MGVDVYMTWDGFGERKTSNPNYAKQITGFISVGRFGYLRLAYSNNKYQEISDCFCWNWDMNTLFTEKLIKEFLEKTESLDEKEFSELKKEFRDFAELGRKLNKQNRCPRIHTSY